jgi:hypothetical protein
VFVGTRILTQETDMNSVQVAEKRRDDSALDSEVTTAVVVDPAVPELDVTEESEYHRVSAGCPRGFTQQCGTGYRT